MNKRHAISLSLLVVLGVFGLWRFWWSALDHNPQQDECTFGTVSNARYRELLVEAKRRQRLGQQAWIPLRGAPEQRADLIRYRIEYLTAGMTSLYERMAAAHAVMRAAGGHITDDTSTGRERSYWQLHLERSGPDPDVGPVAFYFRYALYSSRIGEASLFYPRSGVMVSLVGKSENVGRGYRQLRPPYDDAFLVQFFDPWFPITSITDEILPRQRDITQRGLGCPIVPPAVYAEAYDAWSAARRTERKKP